MRPPRCWLPALLSALLPFAVHATAADPPLAVDDARVRLVPPVSENSVAYLTLRNRGARPVVVVGARSPVCRKVELHRMRMIRGVMEMAPIPSVTVPAHGAFRFAPGKVHLMLIGLKRPMRRDDRVPIVLRTRSGAEVAVDASVVDLR